MNRINAICICSLAAFFAFGLLRFTDLHAAKLKAIQKTALPDQNALADANLWQTDVMDQLLLNDASFQTLVLPAQLNGPFQTQIRLDGVEYTLKLHPHTIRADDFKLLVEEEPGVLVERTPPTPRTLKGTVEQIPDSRAAGSLLNGQLRASIHLPNQETVYSIQPASEFAAGNVGPDMHVIYESEDIEHNENWSCGVDHNIEGFQVQPVDNKDGGIAGTQFMNCDIALDTDYLYYVNHGLTVPSATFDAEDIMNAIETMYEVHSGISITYELTTLIIRTVPGYYATQDPVSRLTEFQEKWNLLMGNVRRDTAHMFSGMPTGVFIIGIAYVGVVCNLGSAYGVDVTDFTTNRLLRICLGAHEIGHNWNAPHCDGAQDCGNMCSAIANCSAPCDTFGQGTVNVIAAHRSTRGCLNVQPDPLSLPVCEDFDTMTFNTNTWSYVHRGQINANATNEPSPDFSMNLNSQNATVDNFQEDDVRTNFILAGSAIGNLILSFATQHVGVESGKQLAVDVRDANLTWNPAFRVPSNGVNQTEFVNHSITLPTSFNHDEFRVRFFTIGDQSNDHWYVDNVRIFEGSCVGDLNFDGSVNVDDLLILIGAWGPCSTSCNCLGDLAPVGGNATINVDDLLTLIGAWGPCP